MAFFRWLRPRRPADSTDTDATDSRLESRFGDSGAPPSTGGRSSSAFQASRAQSPSQQFAIRKDLIRMVLRDILLMAGIPTEWIDAEVLISSSKRRGYTGLYLRLQIRRWDERLAGCTLALQRRFEQRIASLDPTAPEWLVGISWQFAFEEDVPVPKLPHPSHWTGKGKSRRPVDFAQTEPAPRRHPQSA